MYCEPYRAWLSPSACRANQHRAIRGATLTKLGFSVFSLNPITFDRLLVCGPCPMAHAFQAAAGPHTPWTDPDTAAKICRRLTAAVSQALDVLDDAERISRRRETQARYRQAHHAEHLRYMRAWHQRQKILTQTPTPSDRDTSMSKH